MKTLEQLEAVIIANVRAGRHGDLFEGLTEEERVEYAGWVRAQNQAREAAKISRAFDLVSPAHDWRAPIDRYVTADMLDLLEMDTAFVAKAIEHYTATSPTITAEGEGWRFKATGYRNGPAGP